MYSFSISMLHLVALARCTHPGVPCLSVVCAQDERIYFFISHVGTLIRSLVGF